MMTLPGQDEIATWLAAEHGMAQAKAHEWATFLAGLPWTYVKPVVQIAVNSHNHPATALATAATFSSDVEFVATAQRHLEAGDARPSS